MGMWVGRGRKARVAYGFDDIALVPGTVTVNPNEVDISWELCGHRFELPIIAAAMDGVVGPGWPPGWGGKAAWRSWTSGASSLATRTPPECPSGSARPGRKEPPRTIKRSNESPT